MDTKLTLKAVEAALVPLGLTPTDAHCIHDPNHATVLHLSCLFVEPKEFNPFSPLRIVKNGIATIVFWKDGTKTVVKRGSDEPDSDYAAFTAALGIKVFGSNSALKRIVSRTETQEKKGKVNDPDR